MSALAELRYELGKPCGATTDIERMKCQNMKSRENDKDWSGDNYDCKVCGRHIWLDYEEMR
jgi:hypothetical protein